MIHVHHDDWRDEDGKLGEVIIWITARFKDRGRSQGTIALNLTEAILLRKMLEKEIDMVTRKVVSP